VPFVAVGAVSTRRLLPAEGSHVTKVASHTGSTIGRSRAVPEAVRPRRSGRRNHRTLMRRTSWGRGSRRRGVVGEARRLRRGSDAEQRYLLVEPEQACTRGLVIHLAHIASIVRAGRRAAPSCLVLSVLAMVPAACGATSASSTTRSFTATQPTLAVTSCKTAVYGQLAHGGDPLLTPCAPASSASSTAAPTVTPRRQFRESGSGASLRYPGQKLLVVVDRGAT
jgi:hypothetical protein